MSHPHGLKATGLRKAHRLMKLPGKRHFRPFEQIFKACWRWWLIRQGIYIHRFHMGTAKMFLEKSLLLLIIMRIISVHLLLSERQWGHGRIKPGPTDPRWDPLSRTMIRSSEVRPSGANNL